MTKDRTIDWSPNLSYAIGLFVADGCLSNDGRHLEFTSKDEEQVKNFAKCLQLSNSITKKTRSKELEKKYFHVQFGDVTLYRFLNSIGLFSKKSLSIKKVKIPDTLISDFLRGLLDGDGSIGYYNHPESRHIQVRVRFSSGSHDFLDWLRLTIAKKYKTSGGAILKAGGCWQLAYAKADSLILLQHIYTNLDFYLIRKYNVYQKIKSLLEAENSVRFIE